MPIVQAYKGLIKVEGSSRQAVLDNMREPEPFYSKTIVVYGETPGELWDNIVDASVKIANDVFEWCMMNKPADYNMDMDMGKDYWYYHIVHPDYEYIDLNDPKTFKDENDTGGGGSLESVKGIVRMAVISRDVDISHLKTHLSLAKPGPTQIQQEPAVHYAGCYEAESMQEMVGFGWNGKELDSIIATAEAEGRLAMLRESRAAQRKRHEADRRTRVAQAKVEEMKSSRWWPFG